MPIPLVFVQRAQEQFTSKKTKNNSSNAALAPRGKNSASSARRACLSRHVSYHRYRSYVYTPHSPPTYPPPLRTLDSRSTAQAVGTNALRQWASCAARDCRTTARARNRRASSCRRSCTASCWVSGPAWIEYEPGNNRGGRSTSVSMCLLIFRSSAREEPVHRAERFLKFESGVASNKSLFPVPAHAKNHTVERISMSDRNAASAL